MFRFRFIQSAGGYISLGGSHHITRSRESIALTEIGKHQAPDYVPHLQEFFKAYNNIINTPPPAELVQ